MPLLMIPLYYHKRYGVNSFFTLFFIIFNRGRTGLCLKNLTLFLSISDPKNKHKRRLCLRSRQV